MGLGWTSLGLDSLTRNMGMRLSQPGGWDLINICGLFINFIRK